MQTSEIAGGALEGLRVLDLTRLLPGGFCTQMLADLGAGVTKIEDTGAGDYMRWAPPSYEGADASARSAPFLWLNRGKRSIRLNLKDPRGREVLLRLVREADVLIESFRPGVMDGLGVGYARLAEENPRLVYCAISGYGQETPYRARSGHDLNYLGLAGLVAMTGAADGPPMAPAGQVSDIGVALLAAFATLAALRERDRSGRGQLVDVSLLDASAIWLGLVAARHLCDGETPRRGRTEQAVCYRPYACKDGWVTLAALEPKFWTAFCKGIGRDDLAARQFDAPGSETHAALEAIFATRSRAEWKAFADEHDCCLEPVLELDEALASPLFEARGLVSTLAQPGIGQTIRHLGTPLKLSRTPPAPYAPAPGLGEHTRETLAGLGYAHEEIEALLQSGAAAGPAGTVQGEFLA